MRNFIKKIVKFNEGDKENLIHIGYGIDDNYARPMAASIASICLHHPLENFCFHVMTAGLERVNLERLCLLAHKLQTNIVVYNLDVDMLKDLPTQQHLPLPTYFRFLLPLILKEEERLFYIDADIVCLHSLEDLWHRDFQGKIIMAVKDLPWMAKKRCGALGLTSGNYFNAGMLAINLPLWQEFNTFEKVMTAIRQNPGLFRYLDQDGLNLVLENKILFIEDKYNSLAPKNLDQVSLLHFAAHPKPWKYAYKISKAAKHLPQDLYLEVERITPWANTPLEQPSNPKEYRLYAKDLCRHGSLWQGLKYYYKYWQSKGGKA